MKKQIIRRTIAHLLSVLMILSTAGASLFVFGVAAPEVVNAAAVSEIKAGDHITLGDPSAEGYDGIPYWRVLARDKDRGFLLMSEYLWNGNSKVSQYGKIAFRPQNTGNAWKGSNAQQWCSDFYEAVLKDTKGITVQETSMSDEAWTWIVSSTSTTTVTCSFLSVENILDKERVFFLSAEEIETYMPEMTDRVAFEKDGTTTNVWWSRSPEATTTDTGKLIYAGNILKNGKYNKVSVWSECLARPAFYAELSPDLCITGHKTDAGTTDWEIRAEKHELGTPEYKWSDDGSKCTASADCSICGDTISETVDTSAEVTEAATTDKEGVKVLTAAFSITGFETQTKAESVPKLKPSGDSTAGNKQQSETVKEPQLAPVTINAKKVSAATVKKAVKAASKQGIIPSRFVIGKKVKTIKKGAFKGTTVKTLIVKSRKLSKKSVKGSLKGSKITTVKVKTGNKKTTKKYIKKYKKIFTKKNAGRKVKIK